MRWGRGICIEAWWSTDDRGSATDRGGACSAAPREASADGEGELRGDEGWFKGEVVPKEALAQICPRCEQYIEQARKRSREAMQRLRKRRKAEGR